jgi:hypothetical protein
MSEHSPSSLGEKLPADIERAIAEAPSGDVIKKILADYAIASGHAKPDEMNPSILLPVEQPAGPETATATVNINGVQKTFTGKDAADLDRQQIAYFRSLETAQAAPRDEKGRFTADQGKRDERETQLSEAEAAKLIRRNALEIEFRMGRLSAADYLAQTGAIEEHLEKQGVSIEVLKAQTAERVEAANYQQSWADATSEFLRSPAGADWKPSEDAKVRIGSIIERLGQANPDIEKENKVEVLAHAWGIMKRNDAQTKAIESAISVEEIRAAVRGSSLFNR